MIFTESTIKISNNVSKMDSTIVLYRGDKNVEIRFTILQSPFKYSNTVATNVIESTNASYGQLVIKTPNDKPPIFSEVSSTKEGTVLFTITKEMIDEIEEVGVYTFQIRLMDENKQSRVTIPPVENGIEIKEPIAIEDDNTTNVVGLAKANYAVATLSDADTPAFDDNGQYIKTNWNDGDIITNASLNKIEDGIYTTNENVTATKKYVDDNILLEQLPILRIDETNKRIYVNCNNMGTYKKYFVPNKYANVYGFSFIYTNEDSSETEIALIGGAMTRDDFILCARNTDTLFILILGGTDKYKYTKSTKTLEKGLYGYLKIGNTQEYTPTENYHPATKKYVDDNKIACTISSKVLGAVPASTLENFITPSDDRLLSPFSIANASINKDRRYFIEFLGSKKLCSLAISEKTGNSIVCSIGNYNIQAFNSSTNIVINIEKINEDDTTATTFTDLIIYEEEVKYLDNKYLETDLVLQNSISLGRIGDIGTGSSAVGGSVTASGMGSHAEGVFTIASGDYSHAEGSTTTASGVNSHAEGDYTTASGMFSHAEGYGSKASSQFQHVQGKYNIEDKDRKYAHIVGNGAGDAKRSNAHTLDWQGNAWYSGKVTTGAAPVEDMDLTTKKYVDDKVTSLPQLSFNEAGELVVTINGVSKTFVPKNV